MTERFVIWTRLGENCSYNFFMSYDPIEKIFGVYSVDHDSDDFNPRVSFIHTVDKGQVLGFLEACRDNCKRVLEKYYSYNKNSTPKDIKDLMISVQKDNLLLEVNEDGVVFKNTNNDEYACFIWYGKILDYFMDLVKELNEQFEEMIEFMKETKDDIDYGYEEGEKLSLDY